MKYFLILSIYLYLIQNPAISIQDRFKLDPRSLHHVVKNEIPNQSNSIALLESDVTSHSPLAEDSAGQDIITNLQQIPLGKEAKDLLQKNKFVVVPGRNEDDLIDVYINCRKRNEPIFITTDVILHTSHLLFDFNLRIVEIYTLIKELEKLTDLMIKKTASQYRDVSNPELKEAARRNLAFFSVAKKLLDLQFIVPLPARSLAEQELSLISAHQGISLSPIMDASPLRSNGTRGEDYSQYIPRGHYTRNETFETFFKTMTWYGRMAFALPDYEDTRQALLIIKALSQADREGMKLWEKLYEPTVFFVGRTDDLDVYDYQQLANEFFGTTIQYKEITNNKKLRDFIIRAQSIKKTRIGKGYVNGLRFLGQRFIPDAYIFDQLTGYPWRTSPKSLDIMALLGSLRAKELLVKEGDFAITAYATNFSRLEEEFGLSSLIAEDWVDWKQNLYWRWLHCLKPLFHEIPKVYPQFMQHNSWLDKVLLTASASWTELRHDTILYAKPSYLATAAPLLFQQTKGYVEPYPEVYRRIGSLIQEMRKGLDIRGLLLEECKGKLLKFEVLLKTLETISQKELSLQELTEEEYNIIWTIGTTLKDITSFSKGVMDKVGSSTDLKMALVADVHTDTSSGQVLEEAVGSPHYIYTIVRTNNLLQVVKGAVFSYYEFKWPVADKLTDEKWQEMIIKKMEPDQPYWTNSFSMQP